jgi:hypothetical protein
VAALWTVPQPTVLSQDDEQRGRRATDVKAVRHYYHDFVAAPLPHPCPAVVEEGNDPGPEFRRLLQDCCTYLGSADAGEGAREVQAQSTAIAPLVQGHHSCFGHLLATISCPRPICRSLTMAATLGVKTRARALVAMRRITRPRPRDMIF